MRRDNLLAAQWMMMGGMMDHSLRIYTDADNTSTFDPSWVFSDASVMTVDWGDGTPQESHATALTHTYAAGSGRKLVRFSCPDWTKVTQFDIPSDVCVLNLPSFERLTMLSWLGINANQFSGTLPSFALCVVLPYFYGGDTQFSGIIPSFAACTALLEWRGYINQFSGYVAGGFATQKNLAILLLDVNNLTEAAVDAILADCVTSLAIPGRVVCNLTLNGVGNAPPSNPAGLASKATLVAAGWTVTTN